jgi:hypothetical protein
MCHERVSQLTCDRQRTQSRSQTDGRTISSFADLDSIYSPVLEYACQWNPIVQTCEYRCNHLYQFPPFRMSEQLDSIRIEAHYVFEQYGAACTAFNIVPVRGSQARLHARARAHTHTSPSARVNSRNPCPQDMNGDKRCTICEDPNFNPPECYKAKDENGEYIVKHPDCMTKCNMLPNCTSVCTNLLKNTPSYADKTEEDAFMDCCMPQVCAFPFPFCPVKRRRAPDQKGCVRQSKCSCGFLLIHLLLRSAGS